MTARHFLKAGSIPPDALLDDIEADIKSARGAQQKLEKAGQAGLAGSMKASVDELLDERSQVQRGSWRPKHG